MQESGAFNPLWEEEIYAQGRHLNRCPYDFVVSFLHYHAPRDRPRSDVHVLEVGCGAGNNLWFAARQGFRVSGIDGSASAIEFARRRFAEDHLSGDLRVGDFTALPFGDGSVDLVVDRGALCACSRPVVGRALAEVGRVLKPGGRLLFNPYSDRHSAMASGVRGADGFTVDITVGLPGVGPIRFDSRQDGETMLRGWTLLSLLHVESIEMLQPAYVVYAEWRVVAEKPVA